MTDQHSARPLAIVTGASSGIGLELARCCAEHGYDLLIAADEAEIKEAGDWLKTFKVDVTMVQADLATLPGVDRLLEAVGGRPIDALLANAGRGLGRAFIEQNFGDIQHVIDTNITGTLYLIQKVANQMTAIGHGRILITGSIAGFMPGTFNAVYNGTKAFIDSFAYALRDELKDSGVTVTCLMPGATETEFFERAGLMDTRIGQAEKDDPAEVAKNGFEAMMQGDAGVISGWQNKLQVAMAKVLPSSMLAARHRKETEPGSASKH